jgi:hypothetical protein
MSIRAMMAAHPSVAGKLDKELAAAVRHSMYSALICTSCADACVAEAMEMRQCIRICLDCADICNATAMVAIRRAGSNEQMLRATLQICAESCDRCATDCLLHEPEHCHLCAKVCRECAAYCRRAAANIL